MIGSTGMDTLQRKMDADSRNGTFEVEPNHPAYGVRYCEMCGSEVDRHGECLGGDTKRVNEIELAVQAIYAMSRWAVFEPKLCLVLSHKVVNPSCTVREIAQGIGVGKTQASEFLKQVGDIMPVLRPVLGLESPRSRVQVRRRKKEKAT